jgi:hypothetical protein
MTDARTPQLVTMIQMAPVIDGIGFLVVQDSNHQTECVNAGKVYVDGNCLNADTTVVTD